MLFKAPSYGKTLGKALVGGFAIGVGCAVIFKGAALGAGVAIVGGVAWGTYCMYQYSKDVQLHNTMLELAPQLAEMMSKISILDPQPVVN